jgi:acyl-CoA hydrolase
VLPSPPSVDPPAAYAAKLRSPEEAVALVRPVGCVGAPVAAGLPGAFLRALGRRDDWNDPQVLIVFRRALSKPGATATMRA